MMFPESVVVISMIFVLQKTKILVLDDEASFVLIFTDVLKAVIDWTARRIGKLFDLFGFYAVLRNVARYTPANQKNRIISKLKTC